MSPKKIENQIQAIVETTTATKRRIDDLQRDLDALRGAPNTKKSTIDTKQSELDTLKAKLTSALEHALLTLSVAPAAARSVRAAIRRL